jgi:hypothetical protein
MEIYKMSLEIEYCVLDGRLQSSEVTHGRQMCKSFSQSLLLYRYYYIVLCNSRYRYNSRNTGLVRAIYALHDNVLYIIINRREDEVRPIAVHGRPKYSNIIVRLYSIKQRGEKWNKWSTRLMAVKRETETSRPSHIWYYRSSVQPIERITRRQQ